MRAGTRRQSVTLFNLSWKQAHQMSKFPLLCMSANDRESVWALIDLEITNTFQQVGKFTNTASTNNEDQLYMCFFAVIGFHQILKRIVTHSFQKDERLLCNILCQLIFPSFPQFDVLTAGLCQDLSPCLPHSVSARCYLPPCPAYMRSVPSSVWRIFTSL